MKYTTTPSRQVAGASNGQAAVSVAAINGNFMVWAYAPRALGYPGRRAEFSALVARAAAKIGYALVRGTWIYTGKNQRVQSTA